MKTFMSKLAAVAVAWTLSAPALAQPGNPSRGERDFRACKSRETLSDYLARCRLLLYLRLPELLPEVSPPQLAVPYSLRDCTPADRATLHVDDVQMLEL
jgi:hypothetical protein